MHGTQIDDWLFDYGGPAIRYRTAAELLHNMPNEEQIEAELLDSRLVRTWLERVQPHVAFSALHGSKPACFENALGKLTQLGCRAGMPSLDRCIAPFLEWLGHTQIAPVRQEFIDTAYRRPIVAAFLMRAGYGLRPAVSAVARERLDTLYEFCRRESYDIYVNADGYPAIPRGYKRHRLVDPALYPDGRMSLPNLYDMHLLAALPPELRDEETNRKIDTVANYILQPEYQMLPPGYGIALMDTRRYWVIGWSLHLPGLVPADADNREDKQAARRFVRMAVLMAHFRVAHRHRWLHDMYAHLDAFRTAHGTHRFPSHYLSEGQRGYWLLGSYMGLEEDRRRKIALELESTFWMRKLDLLMGE